MTVKEIKGALGSWDFSLKDTCPKDVWDAVDYFGHVFVFPSRLDPAQYGDELLAHAQYGGVVRKRGMAGDDRRTNIVEQGYTLAGVGMAFWLGDDDSDVGKGDVFENAITPASASFATTIGMLLPASGAVTAGTLYSVPGSYSGRHQYETPRTAISYVCDTFAATAGEPVGWRVNPDATLDAGPEADLYVTDPTCIIVKRNAGEDMAIRGVPGQFALMQDAEDYTTRVVMLAEGEGESIATGTADLSPATAYRDLNGNAVKLTRLVSESDTTIPNADARAAAALAQYEQQHTEASLETDDYWIEGAYRIGDYVWVYDPDAGLVDTSNEIVFRGQRLNPMKLQVVEAQWPLSAGYMVAYRAGDGTWYDLTDHMEWDNSETVYVTVGGIGRALTNAGSEPVGSRPNQDTSIPGVPTLIEPFEGSAYLDGRGYTRARVILTWSAPNNVDGSTVLDGDHYEIRYAVDADMIYPATWAQVSQIPWSQMNTWAQPFVAPTGDWQYMHVAWGESTAQLQDLSPGVGYDVQIRAVDKVGNRGAWSSITTFVASEDNIPPSTPAAPSVAGSRIALQVTHHLGKSSGGTFNLESDLQHLEIHVDYEPYFTPSESTLKGKANATAGMIVGEIPVVVTVQVEETSTRYVRVIAVDKTGNKSGPSDAASATALLIDDAHISDLTVSKVTAGTISAAWVLAGEIKTADSGARARMSIDGFELYNAAGTRTFLADADTGDVDIIGQLRSGVTGQRIIINPPDASRPEIRFYPTTGSDYAKIRGYDDATVGDDDASIMVRSGVGTNNDHGLLAAGSDLVLVGRYVVESNLYRPQGGNFEASMNSARVSYYDYTGSDDFGGSLYLESDYAEVGVITADAEAAYMTFDHADGSIRAYGEIGDNTTAQAAIFTDSVQVTGGPYTGYTRTYGTTYTGTPRLSCYLSDSDASGSTVRAHLLTANSSTGFDVTFSGSTTATFTIWWWGWRIN